MPIGKPFPKGKSGNPGGRPKKLRFRLREHDAEAEKALLMGVKEGDATCLKLFFAYRHGLPSQKVEHGGEGGGPLVIEIVKLGNVE